MKRTRKSDHPKILKESLSTLVNELLPLAIEDYKDSRSQSKAYIVTNMLSEVRSVITQIETSIDEDKIILEVSKAVTLSLRSSITRMMNQVVMAKKVLPMKIKDTSARRNFEIILDKITKDYEQNVVETISKIEERTTHAVKELLKGKQKNKNNKKKG